MAKKKKEDRAAKKLDTLMVALYGLIIVAAVARELLDRREKTSE